MRCRIPGLALVLAAATACSAPRPAEMPRTVHETVRDVVLRAENAVIEARVPRNATLDSILRQHQLSADLVNAAVLSAKSVFNPRQLRADRPYRLVLSLDGFLREFEYQIDTDRFLRIINRDSGRPEALDAEVLPFEKESTVAGHPRRHRRRAFVADRGDRRERREHPAGDGARRDLRRSDRLQQRSQAGRSVRGAVREVDARGAVRRLRQHPRRHVRCRRQGTSGLPLDQSRDRQGRLLRRGRPVAEALLPGVAAEVRAARHVAASRAGGCIPCTTPCAPTPGSTTARRTAPRCSRSRPERWCPRAGPARGGNQVPHPPRRRARDLLHAPVVVRAGRSRRSPRRSGAVHRPGGFDRHGDRAAPALFAAARTARSSIPSPSAGGSLPPSRSPRHTAPGSCRRATRCFSRSPATLLADAAAAAP